MCLVWVLTRGGSLESITVFDGCLFLPYFILIVAFGGFHADRDGISCFFLCWFVVFGFFVGGFGVVSRSPIVVNELLGLRDSFA